MVARTWRSYMGPAWESPRTTRKRRSSPRKRVSAAQLFQRACDAGDATGCDYLGDMYALGRGVGKDKARGNLLYQKACQFGGAHACLKIGQYRTGQILKIESANLITPDSKYDSDKARYELTIQDGPDQYMAVYKMNYFQHDRSTDLAAGQDVEYRIEG